jgi:hypothetical protein
MMESCSSTSVVFHVLRLNSHVSTAKAYKLDLLRGDPKMCILICPDTVLLALFSPPFQLLFFVPLLALSTGPRMEHSTSIRATSLIA